MAVDLDDTALVRWRASPIAFIEEMLHDPETGRPFVLLEAERAFMRHAFTLDRNGRLAYPELVYGAIKKSGKTTSPALIVLVMVLLRSDGRDCRRQRHGGATQHYGRCRCMYARQGGKFHGIVVSGQCWYF